MPEVFQPADFSPVLPDSAPDAADRRFHLLFSLMPNSDP